MFGKPMPVVVDLTRLVPGGFAKLFFMFAIGIVVVTMVRRKVPLPIVMALGLVGVGTLAISSVILSGVMVAGVLVVGLLFIFKKSSGGTE